MPTAQPENKTESNKQSSAQKTGSKAESLREGLRTLDVQLAGLSDLSVKTALNLLYLFDFVSNTLVELERTGMKTGSELSHFETISNQFMKKRKVFINQIGGKQILSDARVHHQPSKEQWWWYVDKSLVKDRNRKIQYWLRISLAVTVVLVLTGFIYNQFFAPDPNVVASYNLRLSAETAGVEGDFKYALNQVQQAIAFTPDQPDLYILEGVILSELDRSEEANSSFSSADNLYEQVDQYYNERARIYIMMGNLDQALSDIEFALQINPASAISYINRGQAYEMLGEYQIAVDSYHTADTLADKEGNIQLQAVIRFNLSNAYQRISIPIIEEGEQGN